jgi:hypothetical protein
MTEKTEETEETEEKNEDSAPQPYLLKPNEQAAIEKALEKREIAPPWLKVENNGMFIDHPSRRGDLLMQNALGASNKVFMDGLLSQVAKATGAEIKEADLNFMVSFINGIEPRDQVESALAAQMATVHMAMMNSMEDFRLARNLTLQDAAERGFNRFARTFTAQVEALKRYRSSEEQKVTLQHVSVNDGGQAIVGNVTQNPRETAPDKASSSTLALAHSKVAPMKTLGEAPRKATPARRKSIK